MKEKDTKQKEMFVRLIVASDEDKARFAQFKRIAVGNGQNPFDILLTISESYVQKYNPHQYPLVSRKRIFEIAANLNVSFNDNDFNYFKSTRYLTQSVHYVKQLVKTRYKFVYNEKEMTLFLKWLKKYRAARKISLRDNKRKIRIRKQNKKQSLILKDEQLNMHSLIVPKTEKALTPLSVIEPRPEGAITPDAPTKTNVSIQPMRTFEEYD